jgi:hypothetical protein
VWAAQQRQVIDLVTNPAYDHMLSAQPNDHRADISTQSDTGQVF